MSSINSSEIGRSMMGHVTLNIDMRKVVRTAFGVFRWRLILATAFIWTACRILRCKHQFIKS